MPKYLSNSQESIRKTFKNINKFKKYYDEVLVHIEKNLLKEEEAIQILEDLEDMRADEDEEI